MQKKPKSNTQKQKKVYIFECPYLSRYLLLRTEIPHEFVFFNDNNVVLQDYCRNCLASDTTNMLVLPFLHLHHVKQHDFTAKSVFEYDVCFLNKPEYAFYYKTFIGDRNHHRLIASNGL